MERLDQAWLSLPLSLSPQLEAWHDWAIDYGWAPPLVRDSDNSGRHSARQLAFLGRRE